jgi:hypothetical protein
MSLAMERYAYIQRLDYWVLWTYLHTKAAFCHYEAIPSGTYCKPGQSSGVNMT